LKGGKNNAVNKTTCKMKPDNNWCYCEVIIINGPLIFSLISMPMILNCSHCLYYIVNVYQYLNNTSLKLPTVNGVFCCENYKNLMITKKIKVYVV